MNNEQKRQLIDLVSDTIMPALSEDLGIESGTSDHNKALGFLIELLESEKV
jgi:hypothetical protein